MKTASETSGTTLNTPTFELQGVPEGEDIKYILTFLSFYLVAKRGFNSS